MKPCGQMIALVICEGFLCRVFLEQPTITRHPHTLERTPVPTHLHAAHEPGALGAVAALQHLHVLRHVLVGGAELPNAHAHGVGQHVGHEALNLLRMLTVV